MNNINKNLLQEPQWGGEWTEKKLEAFAKYVSAYLTIMKKNPYWQTIYFDGFAGSGSRENNHQSPSYKLLELTEQEEKIYKGAAERVLSLPNNLSFDFYYFIDTKAESLEKLKNKLSELQKTKENPFQYRLGDCNSWLLELSKTMKKPYNKLASLVLLDPFGMQINWESIESLRDTRTDIWILVPTGVIINRLLDRAGELKNIAKLVSFFGLGEDEIRKYFYYQQTTPTLFGEEERIKKILNPIEQIARIYSKQLQTIWKYVTENPLVLKNTRGVPIFHFIFASNNRSALKIATDIIKHI